MPNAAHCIVRLGLGITLSTLLIAQRHTGPFPPILGWVLTAGVHGQPYPNIGLCHTTDSGKSWRCSNKFRPPVCRPDCSVENVGPVFFDSGEPLETFFVVSFMYTPGGTGPLKNLSARYRTHDGGASWSPPEKFTPPGRDWALADFEFGLAQDKNRTSLTSDGGRTWSYDPYLSRILAPYNYWTFRRGLYRKEHSLWFVAEVGDSSLVVHSANDGSSWRTLSASRNLRSSAAPARNPTATQPANSVR